MFTGTEGKGPGSGSAYVIGFVTETVPPTPFALVVTVIGSVGIGTDPKVEGLNIALTVGD
jgi:hypothetical protein